MKKMKYLTLLFLIFFSLSALAQEEEMRKLLSTEDEFDFYSKQIRFFKKYEEDKSQFLLLKKFKDDPNLKINCILMMSPISRKFKKDTILQDEILKILLTELKNSQNEKVAREAYRIIRYSFKSNEFKKEHKKIVREMYYEQLELFYILNRYHESKEKWEQDSCYLEYKEKIIYFDIIRLAGYLNMKELIPSMKQLILDYVPGEKSGIDEIMSTLIQNMPKEYATDRVINPWYIHLAMAHMGEKEEIDSCINKYLLMQNIRHNEYNMWDFMGDITYIRQPEVVDLFLDIFKNNNLDIDYAYQAAACFRSILYDVPYFYREEFKKEYINWFNDNKEKIKINRIDALIFHHGG